MNKEYLRTLREFSKNLKVLYVEDNKDARESTLIFLEQIFDNIIIAHDGLDGYEKFNTNDIDLIITDINMPQMSGLDMAKRLKSIESVKLKPILALTTEKSPEIMSKGKQVGLAGWIVKPFSPQKLLMGVKRVLRLR